MELRQWEEKNAFSRSYTHFDRRIKLSEKKRYIYDAKAISKHGFFPFLHSKIVFRKYSKTHNKKYKEKIRPISYAGHLDRMILSYYSYMLNNKYNEILKNENLEEIVIAYRTNLGKNNIHFAKEAFEFIKKSEKCDIMIGDFSNFFDNLNHKYLKIKLCEVLECERLSADWYNIYKNITRYSKCNLEDLLKLNNLDKTQIRELNKKDVIISYEIFKNLRNTEELRIDKNLLSKGIPQGSPISSVLSNIYMIDFDRAMKKYVEGVKGLYLRYSDDFIVIFPRENTEFSEHYNFIMNEIEKIDDLNLEKEKTQVFYFGDEVIRDNEDKNSKISYLGFTFDGKDIRMRDKTLSKYYSRMYKKIKSIVRSHGVTQKGNKISCTELYEKYSIKGAFPKDRNRCGNFITYVKKAEKIFGLSSKKIKIISERHMRKIRKRLKN